MKMKIRRGAILFLSFLLTATMICIPTVTAADTADRGVRLYRGTFRYAGTEDTFYYDDSFFDIPATQENEHLRTLSAALAFSVSGDSAQNTIDLLTDIGMDQQSIVVDEMVHGTRDTLGTIIAHKRIGDETLVAVAIRGSDYNGEWASNVLAGTQGDAEGFSEATAKVSERLLAYLSENDIDHAKIWVCGYSRAGGVADLLGRYMNEAPETYATEKDDIYVYTFEAPRSSADDTVYENIRNITDVNDLVPYLYPASWGLHLNGVTEKIGDPDDTLITKVFKLNVDGYIADYQERAQSLFLEQFDSFLGSAVSREQYAASMQEHISALCSIYFSKTDSERDAIMSYLSAVGDQIKDAPELVQIITRACLGIANMNDVNTLSKLITDALDTLRETEDPPLSDEEYDTLKEAVTPLVTLVIQLGNNDGSYKELNEQGKSVYVSFYHILTFALNLYDLIEPHYGQNIFEKLKQMDSYYTAGVRVKPGDVIIGQKRYTFDDYGWQLEDIVRDAGFTDDEIGIWRNGYELRLENVLTKIDVEPGSELFFAASGKFDKSMSMYEYDELTMTKTVGFRAYPVDGSVKLSDNPICLTIPRDIAKKCVRFGVVRVDDLGVNHQYKLDDVLVKFSDNGDALLWVNGSRPAIYASAIDDRRYCTSADVDWDDAVSVMDVTHIQRHLAYMESFSDYQKQASDVDGDGNTTTVDVTWIQRFLAKETVPFDIGEKISIQE